MLTTDCVHLQERVLPWCYKFAVSNACAYIGGRVQGGSGGPVLVLNPVLQPVLAGEGLCRVCVLSLVGWSIGLEGWKTSWPVLAGMFATDRHCSFRPGGRQVEVALEGHVLFQHCPIGAL